jgi:hypothetical protein
MLDPFGTSGDNWTFRILWSTASELPDSLADLVPLVEAAGNAYDGRSAVDIATSNPAAAAVSSERQQILIAAADGFLASLAVLAEGFYSDELAANAAAIDDLEVFADPWQVAGPLMNGVMSALEPDALRAELRTVGEAQFFNAYVTAVQRQARTPKLLQALFVTAMGALEPMLGQLVPRLLYTRSPDEYTSLADPKLAQATRKFTSGNPSDWRRRLTVTHRIDTLADTVPWDDLIEAWGHRNDIHHRGGQRDPHEAHANGKPLFSPTEISTDYLLTTIDQVLFSRLALVAGIAEQVAPGLAKVLATAPPISFSVAYRARRWGLAVGIARLKHTYPLLPEAANDAQVEVWLATSAAHGLESIRNEVDQWDTDALDPVYTVAKCILLGEFDRAAHLLAQVVADGQITDLDLADWPIFDPLRDSGHLP